MPRKTITRVEGKDEASLMAAITLAEKGPVSYSDKYIYISRIDDPDEVVSYIEMAVNRNIAFVVERVGAS